MGMKKTTENGILYRSNMAFGLGFKNLEDANFRAQVVKWHIMKWSLDPNARALYVYKQEEEEVKKKRSPCRVIKDVEDRVYLLDLCGGQTDRKGAGSSRPPSTTKEKRQRVLTIVKNDDDARRTDQTAGYAMQTNWRDYGLNQTMQADLTRKQMLYGHGI
jgi:hypothetical protein